MAGRKTAAGGPLVGAVQVSKLARRQEADAIGWVEAWYRERGWLVADEGAGLIPAGGGYVMVTVWAVPPSTQARQAAKGAVKAEVDA